MKILKIGLIGAIIGIINAFIFVIFEFIVTEGTLFLWNTIFQSQIYRILVLPLAVVLSIVYSWVIRRYKEKRIIGIETNILEQGADQDNSYKEIIKIFIIGSISLLAGASLGPEASLSQIAKNLGIVFSKKLKDSQVTHIFMLSSIGALLVAFTGSLFPISLPILLLYKQQKKIHFQTIFIPLITGFSSFVILTMIQGTSTGLGDFSLNPAFRYIDLVIAFLLGLGGSILAIFLKRIMKRFEPIPKRIDASHSWIYTASVFGLFLGIFYLLGGPVIQFSGKEGSEVLIQQAQSFSIIMLLVMIIMKIIVTGWSITTGYRGGVVFPSIFFGVAFSLLFEKLHPIFTGSGVMIGTSTGIMVTLLSPVLGFIMMVSFIPFQLITIAIAGLLGSLLGIKVYKRITHQSSHS